MEFQIQCENVGFEEIPGAKAWGLGGKSVSGVGGREQEGRKKVVVVKEIKFLIYMGRVKNGTALGSFLAENV